MGYEKDPVVIIETGVEIDTLVVTLQDTIFILHTDTLTILVIVISHETDWEKDQILEKSSEKSNWDRKIQPQKPLAKCSIRWF